MVFGLLGNLKLGTIRFLLALSVVAAHVRNLPFSVELGSLLAVQAFYVISGFLIALVWTNKYRRQPRGLLLFYTNRAARIYILYWVVLVLSIVLAQIIKTTTHNYPAYFGSQPHALLPYRIFINAFIFGSSWAYWLGFDDSSGLYFTMDFTTSDYPVWGLMALAPAWTLDLELTFYLLAPLLVNLRLRYIFGLIAASLIARFAWYAMGHDIDPWNYRFFPFEIGLFLAGVATYRVWSALEWKPNSAVLAILFLGLVISILDYSDLGLSHGAYASFAYLFVFAAAIPYVFELTKSWKVDRFLADMSFPLYLAHWPVSGIWFYFRDYLHLSSIWPNYLGLVPAILSVAAAALLVIFVERPVEKWRQSRLTQQKDAAPVAAAVSAAPEMVPP
jgi:peptidoglycan/LPS O-acetylase OafA/YrhL